MQYSKNIYLDLISKHRDTLEPIHPRFEIRLLTNAFSKHSLSHQGPEPSKFRTLLERYLQQHHRLPNGRYRIIDDSDESVGSVDFGKIRAKVRSLQKQKNMLNIHRLQSSSEGFLLQLGWEMRIGLSHQNMGNIQNEAVFRIREQEVRNLNIFSTHTLKSHG